MGFRNRTQAGNTPTDARRPSLAGAIPLGLRKAASPHANSTESHNPKFVVVTFCSGMQN